MISIIHFLVWKCWNIREKYFSYKGSYVNYESSDSFSSIFHPLPNPSTNQVNVKWRNSVVEFIDIVFSISLKCCYTNFEIVLEYIYIYICFLTSNVKFDLKIIQES